MKWIYVGWLLVGLLIVSVFLWVVDVIFIVNGKVVVRFCMVFIVNVIVELGDFYIFSLIGVGLVLVWYSVVLDLSNCFVGILWVKVIFSGMVDSIGYYKNQGMVGNIQFELQNEDGIMLNNGSSQLVQVDEVSQFVCFLLQVRVLFVNGGVM